MQMLDACGRRIDYLRISITDRCNLRCVYCMPENGVSSISHDSLLRYEEIVRLVRLMQPLGVQKVRITGGEPMARRGCLDLVQNLHEMGGLSRIAMTTNALLLRGRMQEARDKGLTSINISLDTLDPVCYRQMTRLGNVTPVLDAIDEALTCGLSVKVNAVPVRGMNENDLVSVAALAQDQPVCVRFIELMPVGCGAAFSPIPTDEVLAKMEAAFGTLLPDETRHGDGPARYVKPHGFVGSIGVIGAVSHEFCDRCNRVRLTADGFLKLCLNHSAGLNLRELLRSGASDEQITAAIYDAIQKKPQRHGFYEALPDREGRRMNEIGG